MCVECYFSKSPGQAPYGANSACAKRAAYPDPAPVVPHPESLAAQAAYTEALLVWLRPELFSGIGVLPGPSTGSHIVNRGTPVTVAPLGQPQLSQRSRSRDGRRRTRISKLEKGPNMCVFVYFILQYLLQT